MSFIRHINPTGAISDFRTVFRDAGSNRWRIAVLAALTTIGIFSVMAGESWKRPRPLPEIIYITSWPLDRTEEETRAFVAANQKRKEAREKLQQEQDQVGRDMWKTLGKVSGMDVDKLARQAEAERTAEQAAEAAKLKELTRQSEVAAPEPAAPQPEPDKIAP